MHLKKLRRLFMPRFKAIAQLSRMMVMIVAVLAMSVHSLRANDVDGFTEPYRTINVAAAEQGVITSLLVKEGDTVHKGQLLATLDSDVWEAAKEIAKAGQDSMGRIKSATAALELKKERLEKIEELQAEGHAHPEEVMRAKTDLEIAEAELLAAREDQIIKSLEYARIQTQLERRKIVSPIDGVVTKIHKEVSEYVAATDPAVLTVVQCSRLKIIFPVPAPDAAYITVGQKIPVNFPGGMENAEGIVEVVNPVTDPESGTVRVKVVLDNAKGHYRSGMGCFLKMDTLSQRSLTNVMEKKTPTLPDKKTEKQSN
jgi:RND family efflux transporter MFP subunit